MNQRIISLVKNATALHSLKISLPNFDFVALVNDLSTLPSAAQITSLALFSASQFPVDADGMRAFGKLFQSLPLLTEIALGGFKFDQESDAYKEMVKGCISCSHIVSIINENCNFLGKHLVKTFPKDRALTTLVVRQSDPDTMVAAILALKKLGSTLKHVVCEWDGTWQEIDAFWQARSPGLPLTEMQAENLIERLRNPLTISLPIVEDLRYSWAALPFFPATCQKLVNLHVDFAFSDKPDVGYSPRGILANHYSRWFALLLNNDEFPDLQSLLLHYEEGEETFEDMWEAVELRKELNPAFEANCYY